MTKPTRARPTTRMTTARDDGDGVSFVSFRMGDDVL
jgi:hypothetical protein